MEAMQNETLMVAAAVLDPFTHYRVNLSNLPEYASALTDVIEKIADPESALLAINEISTYRECRGRFSHSLARSSAERMAPTEWWFQFGGEVPNLQKWALRIVSQCVSSSGCERNWSTRSKEIAFYTASFTKVFLRYNLKLRAEEDEDIVKLSYREKEIDPCAMMMDTVMHDESNPMMEWLNEDEEHIVLDGSDAATAVLEEIRRLNSRRKASHLGRKEISRKGKRVREDEEDEFISSEDDDEANVSMDIDDGDDGQEEDNDRDDESDGEGLPRQENLVNCRSGRQAKKVKDVNSLYY
ncbi:unnamed protein product [Alopecurus aequalis]